MNEIKENIKTSFKGINNPFYGKHHTEETKFKLRLANKGKVKTQEFKDNIRIKNTGRIFTQEHKDKISLSNLGRKPTSGNKGRKFTEEHRLKISISKKNKHLHFKISKEAIERRTATRKRNNKQYSEEARRKIGLASSIRNSGINHPNWKGGLSNQPYPFEFNHSLKEFIRSRDNYECQLCHVSNSKYKLHVHHIDYDKNNLNINNLVSLCYKCHTKTNFNRDYYTKYFQDILAERFKRKVE